jgi:DTW domain-containing protein YfiP
VVFLQHPREYRMAIGTARMTNLGLANSELHIAAELDRHPRVRALTDDPSGTALLFPGSGAVEPEALPDGPPATLVVLDGTWLQAKKMLARSARLQRLPRVGFVPERPGAYRIRREPAAHCLATVEAVVQVLGRLEGDRGRFRPLLGAFEQMVEQQLHFKTARPNPYFHARRARPSERDRLRTALAPERERLVTLHVEVNASGHEAPVPGRHQLLQLTAERFASGERFAALIAARRPLAPSVPSHLELSPSRFAEGEDLAIVLERFAAFLRADDRVCMWGQFPLDVLHAEGVRPAHVINVRELAARALARSPGGPEQAAAALAEGRARTPWTDGRAGRRIAALDTIVAALLSEP